MGENMYCGIGPIPRGKIRGTPEYCIQTNQVRYYGLELIDKKLLKSAKGKSSDIVKEQLKLKKIEDDAKFLIKEVRNIKVITEDRDAKPSQQKRAQKKLDELLVRRDKLVKKLKTQKEVVETLEKEEARLNKKAKENSKLKTKSSGSKTQKKRSGSKRR